MTTYEKIKKLCEDEGFAISSLPEKIPELSINKASITGWKNGSKPRPAKIKMIADYFGVTTDYLTNEEERPASKPFLTDEDLKIALFGGDEEVTDEMWEEAVEFARFIIEREKKKRKEKE